MKRRLHPSLIVSVLLFCHAHLWSADINPPAIIRLGKVHGQEILCQISIVAGNDSPDEVHLQFQTHDRAEQQKTFDIMAGQCIMRAPKTLSITVEDYIGLGRKQVFVSAACGATVSHLYDCDGRDVYTLYRHEEGRDEVKFMRRHGKWRLAECYAYSQRHSYGWYIGGGDDNLGTAFVVYPPNGNVRGKVVRTLHWNGDEFVPDLPGPTKIVERPRTKA